MRWHAPERFSSFHRWLTRFAEMLDIPRRDVCLEQAYFHYRRGDDPFDTFKSWARILR